MACFCTYTWAGWLSVEGLGPLQGLPWTEGKASAAQAPLTPHGLQGGGAQGPSFQSMTAPTPAPRPVLPSPGIQTMSSTSVQRAVTVSSGDVPGTHGAVEGILIQQVFESGRWHCQARVLPGGRRPQVHVQLARRRPPLQGGRAPRESLRVEAPGLLGGRRSRATSRVTLPTWRGPSGSWAHPLPGSSAPPAPPPYHPLPLPPAGRWPGMLWTARASWPPGANAGPGLSPQGGSRGP